MMGPPSHQFEKQAKDADLSVILDQLADAVEPGEGVLFLAGPAANPYWFNKEQFTQIDEVLYWNRDHYDEKDLVTLKGLRAEAIWLSLDLSSPSHQCGPNKSRTEGVLLVWDGRGGCCRICCFMGVLMNFGHPWGVSGGSSHVGFHISLNVSS